MQSVRVVSLLFFVLAMGCENGRPDPRTAEIWVIDFRTHALEVAQVMIDVGLDSREVETATLAYLEEFFSGLPITFEIGETVAPVMKSSICVREGSGTNYGRGIVDSGNSHAVRDCGEPDGTEHGAFINRIADVYEPQVSGKGYTRDAKTDMFAKLLALVLAHEIGHGLGLEHSAQDYGPGDIMKSRPWFDVRLDYYFNVDHKAQLLENIVSGH